MILSQSFLQALIVFFSRYKSDHYEKKAIILHAEDLSSDVFFIKKGYVRVYSLSEKGEELTLTILEPGNLFPVYWFLSNKSNPHYLEAVTSLEVWRAPEIDFKSFVEGNPNIFYELTKYLLDDFGNLLNRMEQLITSRAYTKVATTLLGYGRRFGKRQGDSLIVDLPLTHKDIATLVGITRETACLEMKKLEKKGLIAHQGRILVIKDLKGLEDESFPNEAPSILSYQNS